jgi:PAS domain S-box-containing protein
VLGAFLFAAGGGYLLGGLRRDMRVRQLVNSLKLQMHNKESAQEKLLLAELRQERQKASLARLAVARAAAAVPLEYFKLLVAESAHTLNVGRVSIWFFSPDKQLLVCEVMYQLDNMSYSSGQEINALELPKYFAALSRERVIAAGNSYEHTAMEEFVADYLPKNNIGALLDATIWTGNEIIGVICHEHIGGTRDWTIDEQNFAAALSDMVSVALESQKRKKIETDLLEQQANLETIVKTRIENIESNAKLFRFLVARAPINILYMNRATEVIEINPEVELESGYSREFALGKTFYALFSNKKTRAQHLALFKKILSGEKIQGQELLMQRADGQMGEYSISASMEHDANGEPVIIAIAQDITQQKMVEQALQKARESAESADRIKSMFVASMSHELRTPLNSIIGFLGVVLHGMSGEINARQKDQLGRAYNSSKHLLALISDVIDISKIEAGFLQIHTEKFELLSLLEEIQHAVHHITEEKKLILHIDCAKGITLNTDRKRLYQVILNVVSNAVKYTEQGSVNVSAALRGERLIVAVQDTGIGIDEEGLANLFKPFERVDSRLRIKTLGTGLGLYLTQKILTQLLGGSIEVVSTPEVGSVFTINIPINAPEPSEDGVISVLESTKK